MIKKSDVEQSDYLKSLDTVIDSWVKNLEKEKKKLKLEKRKKKLEQLEKLYDKNRG